MSLQDSINQLSQKYDTLNQRLLIIENQDAQPNTFTKLEFQNKFTFEELVAIKVLEATDVGLQVIRDQQKDAKWIDITDNATILGVMYVNSKLPELITVERVSQILSPRGTIFETPETPTEPDPETPPDPDPPVEP